MSSPVDSVPGEGAIAPVLAGGSVAGGVVVAATGVCDDGGVFTLEAAPEPCGLGADVGAKEVGGGLVAAGDVVGCCMTGGVDEA